MNKYYYSCGCTECSTKRPKFAKCSTKEHAGIVLKFERLCLKCNKYFAQLYYKQMICPTCSKKKITYRSCVSCGKRIPHTTNTKCKACRDKNAKKVLPKEDRKIECNFYYECLDMAAFKNLLRLGCESCEKFTL